MKRKIYEKMLAWKASANGKSALMLDGARRVGKSYIAEEFARNEYESYLLIDFAKVSRDVKGFFMDYLDDLDTFFLYLQGAYHVTLTPRKSVLIFDEVQRFPRAREAIKHLVADGRFDYIETGSLISIQRNVKNILIPSEEHHLEMFPMDFEEFLWANGADAVCEIIRSAYNGAHEIGDGMHRRIMGLLREYLVVGGMPQAVAAFVNGKDLAGAEAAKRDILTLYRSDIMKFGGASKHTILSVFNALPSALSRHEWRFRPGEIRKGSAFRSFEATFEWLKSSMTVNVAYNTTEPNVGLELTSDHTTLKCYMGDTGLLVSMAFSERELFDGGLGYRLISGKVEMNAGMLYENLVAQMLRAAGHPLYFYTTSAAGDRAERMEIDFLLAKSQLQRRHNIMPVEVKSSGEYATRSLDKFAAKFDNYLADACILHPKDVCHGNGKVYLPLYMAHLIGL